MQFSDRRRMHDYAAHRASKGLQNATFEQIKRAIDNGTLTLEEGCDFEAKDREWNSRPAMLYPKSKRVKNIIDGNVGGSRTRQPSEAQLNAQQKAQGRIVYSRDAVAAESSTRQVSLDPLPLTESTEPRAEGEGQVVGEVIDYNTSRTRVEHYKAKQAQLDYEKDLGNLVPREKVEIRLGQIVTMVRTRLLLLPDKLAPRVAVVQGDVLQARSIINREIRDALTALSQLTIQDLQFDHWNEAS